jgi:hypothetical protein
MWDVVDGVVNMYLLDDLGSRFKLQPDSSYSVIIM